MCNSKENCKYCKYCGKEMTKSHNKNNISGILAIYLLEKDQDMIVQTNWFDFWKEHIEFSKFEKFHQYWLTSSIEYFQNPSIKTENILRLYDNYMMICK